MAKTNSVFKKVVMAVSGIIMVLFLIAHMIGNLHVFQGAESFNDYSEWLRTVGEPALPPRTLLTVIEIVLLVSVIAHMWSAIALWRQAKRARPQAYVTKKSVAQSYASRTMRWGGVIIALFIVYHILDLTFGVAKMLTERSRRRLLWPRVCVALQTPWRRCMPSRISVTT